jgi:hypothetical protein
MADFPNLVGDDSARRDQLQKHPTLNGIDYIEVSAADLESQRYLHVHFIKSPPPAELVGSPNRFRILGGTRLQNIQVLEVTQKEQHLVVTVDQAGDFSTYTLSVDSTALDPAYARCDFSFKAGCASRFDCRPCRPCLPEKGKKPLIDYMAKDYAGFRQVLIDLITTLVPDWQERHAADAGIALVELLAYTADHLSYYQDAVANEAYLETARRRISVRRHAKLIDYRMHDGASARAFIHVGVHAPGSLPKGTQVLTPVRVPLGAERPPHDAVLSHGLKALALASAEAVFETMEAAMLCPALNEIHIHTWGKCHCCLPRGTTTIDLQDDLSADLRAGDFLLLEEVKGPETGLAADANPEHRQVVRLRHVEKAHDPLLGRTLTRVTWNPPDALAFSLCLSTRSKDGGTIENVSIARGNLVLADHGRTLAEWHPGDPGDLKDPRMPGIQTGSRAFRFRLKEGPLSFRIPIPKTLDSAAALRQVDLGQLRNATAQVNLEVHNGTGRMSCWKPVPDLFGSDRFARHFVAETDNDGRAVIRFGSSDFGMAPPDQSFIKTTYRVGVGSEGNVGSESLRHLIRPLAASRWPSVKTVRNPLAAWGGIAPEPIEEVKCLAPAAFHAEQFRAVTEADYADAAEKHREVSKAVATFRWTGSWQTIFVTIDPVGRTDVSADLKQRVRDWVTRYTLAGYDLKICPPLFVPLEIEIDVCVASDHFRASVAAALSSALSNRRLPDGTRGVFHPDNFTFGQPLYLSRLYAAIESVQGVGSAMVRRFIRRDEIDPEPNRPASRKNLERSYISAARLEVIRLDNDASFPENGLLQLNMMGGK